MSSTNRGAERVALDAYYTPTPWPARASRPSPYKIVRADCWEPHAGGGAFVRAMMEVGAWVTVSDVNPEAPVYVKQEGHDGLTPVDFLASSFRCEWIVGNPPYGDAEEHVRAALSRASVGVAFLLRLAFLESTKRLPFWRENPPAEVYVLSRRPSFTGGGTDSAAYGWFVWRRGNTDEPVLRWLDWSAS